jgi:TetR/AcrR family transcriptional regulator, regulator of cefoperazone and chloramphenicol sensitivity
LAEPTIAQQRLLEAALEVFASKGYEGASTREICRLGGVNVAAIHYYFGDKASLYREVFRLPEQLRSFPAEMDDPGIPVRDVLAAFYRHITSFIVAPEQVRHPSGVLEDQTEVTRRMHDQVVGFLCRATGAAEPDAALHQLAFSIAGLALVLFVQRAAVDLVAPELLHGPDGLQATVDRLADHALALIEAESARRRNAAACATSKRRVRQS